MDDLAEKTQKKKVISAKLKNTKTSIANLEEEKSLVKGCVSDINQRLLHIIESHDSLFTILVSQFLLEKFQPVITLLNQIQGVSGSGASMKQGESMKERLRRKLIGRIMKLLVQVKTKAKEFLKMTTMEIR